jgi:hypothetical protein
MSYEERNWREEVTEGAEVRAGEIDVPAGDEVVVIDEEGAVITDEDGGAAPGADEAALKETAAEPAAERAESRLAVREATGPTTEERTWAALAHASVLLTFALGVSTGGLAVLATALAPLAIWLAFRDKSRFVAFHALQATVFQLAALVAWVAILAAGVVILIPVWIITALLLIVLVGLLLLPVAVVLTIALPVILIALPFASLVYGLYAAFEVYSGRPFRYWLVADWVERRGASSTA